MCVNDMGISVDGDQKSYPKNALGSLLNQSFNEIPSVYPQCIRCSSVERKKLLDLSKGMDHPSLRCYPDLLIGFGNIGIRKFPSRRLMSVYGRINFEGAEFQTIKHLPDKIICPVETSDFP